MSNLDLKMPDQPPVQASNSSNGKGLLIINSILIIVCIAVVFLREPTGSSQVSTQIQINATESVIPFQEDLVIKLKKAGAFEEAAALIDNALQNKNIDATKKASLLKRKGDLLAQTNNKGKALLAYYYAEELNNNQDSELSRKLTQAIIDTLRRMGKYSSVSSEIARKNRQRSGDKKTEKDPTVAVVDGVPLKMSDFEVDLQNFVSNEVARLTLKVDDPAEIQKITEQVRKQYSAPYEKLKYLQNFVTQDVLYRDAQKWKLEEHPKFIESMDAFRKNLLRNLLIQENIKIDKIDESDLNNFIETHRSELSLSTDAGTLAPDQLASIKPLAIKLYKDEKTKELTQKFQQELFKRHKIEIIREPFTEGAR
jgi:hypothetical protein